MEEVTSKDKAPPPETVDESTTANTKRSMRPRADVWDHSTLFHEGSERKAKCNYCVSRVKLLLKKWMHHDEEDVRAMGVKMMAKAEKYWGDPKKLNKLIYVAVVVDPTYKFEFIEYGLVKEYGENDGKEMAKGIMDAMKDLLDAYKEIYQPRGDVSINVHENVPSSSPVCNLDPLVEVESIGDMFKKQKRQKDGSISKSELDIYLEDKNDVKGDFNILNWWKINEHRYPILSRLARDVLSMPISTMASESAFSSGTRVLDPFRSSLTPKIAECLVCTHDWIRRSRQLNSIEEDLESIEKLEEAMKNVGASDVNEHNLDFLEIE